MSEHGIATTAVAPSAETRIKRLHKASMALIQRVEEANNRLDNLKGRLLGSYDGPDAPELKNAETPDYCDIEMLEHLLTRLEGKLDRVHMQIEVREGI